MTIKELIKDKNYDYISMRATAPESIAHYEPDIFIGACSSKAGELISEDGDTYSDEEEVLSFEEWTDEENGIKNGLTIVTQGHWITGEITEERL